MNPVRGFIWKHDNEIPEGRAADRLPSQLLTQTDIPPWPELVGTVALSGLLHTFRSSRPEVYVLGCQAGLIAFRMAIRSVSDGGARYFMTST
jgi:hypothetical protein